MSIMPAAAHGYPPMAFDLWTQAHAAQPYFSMTNGYANYDFARSPNTSGGSDESINSKTDPKNSPGYRQKRIKNNEAAKKSRRQRKEREIAYAKENESLKAQLATLMAENAKAHQKLKELTEQLNTLSQMTVERDYLYARNDELQRELQATNHSSKYAAHHNILREVTNANQIVPPKFENL